MGGESLEPLYATGHRARKGHFSTASKHDYYRLHTEVSSTTEEVEKSMEQWSGEYSALARIERALQKL
jgi:hypothetical protein